MKKNSLYKTFAAFLAAVTLLSGCGSHTSSSETAIAETETDGEKAETEAENELSVEDIYYQYVNDSMVPKYGLADLEPQTGSVKEMTDYWLNPCGIYSAYIADLDADGEEEMAVFRYAKSEADDENDGGWPGDSYCLYVDVFAQEKGQVVLKDSQVAALYDKYDITTLNQANFCSTDIYVTAVTLDDGIDFVITGVNETAVDWADGINRDAWAINFDGEKLNFDFGLIETEGGSEEPIYSDYEAGSDPVEYLNYRDNDIDESYEAALAEFLQEHGVKSAVYTETGSPVAESDDAVRILELNAEAAGSSGQVVDFVFHPADKTDLRAQLEKLDSSSADAANDYSGLITAALNESGNVAKCGSYSFVIPQINLGGSEIDALNKKIYDKYVEYYNMITDDPESGWHECDGVFYEWAVADGKLSLVIYASLYPDASGWEEPEVFTIDIESSHVCTQQELMEYFGMSAEHYRKLVKDAMGNCFCNGKNNTWQDDSFSMGQFEKTIADDNIDRCVLYVNSEGHPGIYSWRYSLAAGDYYPLLIDLTIYVINDWYDENYGPSSQFDGPASDLSEYKGSSDNAPAAGNSAKAETEARANSGATTETNAAQTAATIHAQTAAETTAAATTAQTQAQTAAAAAQTAAPTTAAASDGSYIIPGSDSRYITEADIAGMSSDTIQLAINEIYARHGRRFDRADVQAYFDSKSWYHGTISSAAFDESVFNKYEWDNIDFLVAHK